MKMNNKLIGIIIMVIVATLFSISTAFAGGTKRKATRLKLDKTIWQIEDSRLLSQAQKVAKAMGYVESGGKPIKGRSGEMKSVWQYTEPTWKSISKAYNKERRGVNQPLPMTLVNEEVVTVWKVGKLLQKGHTAEEVAIIWNGSLGGSEKVRRIKGVNKFEVRYDTVAHAKKVTDKLYEINQNKA